MDKSTQAASRLLAFRFLSTSQLLYRNLELMMGRELGLSVRQWRVMFFLANDGVGSVQEIADFCRYDKSQVSRALQELTDKAYVNRVPGVHDRRKVLASLTPAGIEVYRQGLRISLARDERMKRALSADELAAFNATLDKLAEQAQAIMDEL